MTKQEAERSAEPVVREIVNCIAERRYADIEKYAEFEYLSLSEFTELIEGFLEINKLPYMDRFEVPCSNLRMNIISYTVLCAMTTAAFM